MQIFESMIRLMFPSVHLVSTVPLIFLFKDLIFAIFFKNIFYRFQRNYSFIVITQKNIFKFCSLYNFLKSLRGLCLGTKTAFLAICPNSRLPFDFRSIISRNCLKYMIVWTVLSCIVRRIQIQNITLNLTNQIFCFHIVGFTFNILKRNFINFENKVSLCRLFQML